MGLKKSIGRTENKVKGDFPNSYWRITNIKLENGKVFLDVKAFVDQDARKLELGQNSGPMMPGGNMDINISNKNYNFDEGLLPSATLKTSSESSRLKHVCYNYLKSIDDFRNSEDVFEIGQNVKL